MKANRWHLLAVPAALATALFAACGGSGSSGSGDGGAGGAGSTADTGTPSSTSTSPPTTSSGGTKDAGPIDCPGGDYTNVPKGECDLLQQDCPPGETCRPLLSGGKVIAKCAALTGLKGPAETCADDNECLAGLHCMGKQCTPVCCPGNNQPCGGGMCNLEIQLQDNVSTMQVCRYGKQCKVLTENACDPGLECHIEDTTQGLATCVAPSPTPVKELETCKYINDCGTMQHCTFLNGAMTGVCYYYCWLNPPSMEPAGLGGCNAGTVCTKVDLGVDNLGLCIPPKAL